MGLWNAAVKVTLHLSPSCSIGQVVYPAAVFLLKDMHEVIKRSCTCVAHNYIHIIVSWLAI